MRGWEEAEAAAAVACSGCDVQEPVDSPPPWVAAPEE
jgi:hypothetical protein